MPISIFRLMIGSIRLNGETKIYDACRTQLEPDTFTALGIGPAPEYKIDPLIKDLKSL
jgi:peptidyl-tRNA hydrolase